MAEKEGKSVIEGFVKTLPGQPGVYRMLDSKGAPLYVGKAKNLKKRVTAYTQPEKQTARIRLMISLTTQMEFTVTRTETEALLLEANLIKKLKPRYNILLRDDKSFPYILISGNHDFPLLTKHRGAKDKRGEYFGPFASGSAVNETIALLQRAFQLRNCPDTVFAQRTRPCLQYQIKRCTAPCVAKVTRTDYAKQVEMARDFLSGKTSNIQKHFAAAMQDASARMDYEAAALFRDRIRALTHIQTNQSARFDGDIFAIHRSSGSTCVQVFFFRGGQNFGNRAYFPRHEKDDENADILAAFIAQFYAARPAPKDILVSETPSDKDILEKALHTSLSTPSRGGKKDLMQLALKNAKDALTRKRAADATQEENLEALSSAFGLESAPQRIEVYDNSHISGSHAVGAMIVATPEGFQKSSYRKFNMSKETAGDDFGMMREMLTRRFSGDTPRPDLLLIDGGQGQLSAALKVLADLGLTDLPIAAMAKGPDRNAGRERFFMPGREAFVLEQNSPLLHFLQRLRDEAHRFAIISHRSKRSRAIGQNPLDEVPGIGGKRKKALLLHFGSAKAVAEAGVADLQKVSGISNAIAQKVYNFFHGDQG